MQLLRMVEKISESNPIFDRQIRIPEWKQSVVESQVSLLERV